MEKKYGYQISTKKISPIYMSENMAMEQETKSKKYYFEESSFDAWNKKFCKLFNPY